MTYILFPTERYAILQVVNGTKKINYRLIIDFLARDSNQYLFKKALLFI